MENIRTISLNITTNMVVVDVILIYNVVFEKKTCNMKPVFIFRLIIFAALVPILRGAIE